MCVSFPGESEMETEVLQNAGDASAQEVGVAGGDRLEWLKGSFLQSALCQIFQRFALEGDTENRALVHKVIPISVFLA